MQPEPRKRRVVLVDDSPEFRRAVETFLRSLGNVEFAGSASDGESGLKLFVRTKPDAGVVDVNMPGLNGFELAERLLAGPEAPAIILVTGSIDAATRDAALRLGVHAVLQKDNLVGELPEALAGLPWPRREADA